MQCKMIFDDISSGLCDSGAMKEIRPGRKLFCRKVTTSIQDDSSSNEDEQLHILFVHGSCAASSQYDALVAQLSDALERSRNNSGTFGDKKLNIGSIQCYLYDQLGCAGSSQHPSSDWGAFSSEEHLLDLQVITQSILQHNREKRREKEKEETKEPSDEDTAALYIVAHSYGVSQTIKLVTDALSPADTSRIKGLILIGGALKDGPASAFTQDGGHWIFRYVPMFLLRQMQPSLSKSFVEAAVHPNNIDRLRQSGTLDLSDRNDMAMCTAFYRQQKYATGAEASKVKVKSLIIHGNDDLVLPLSAGEHLNHTIEESELVVLSEASHQVFEEKPREVADEIMKFIINTLHY